ncbi:neurotensin receptor type 1-like [Saccostrea echinata]|uniref:neurotensin receptor type 1-like n=1 Tax=Saccostrea echinata TaxID=191078 RepID=UPI002A806C36|nr:neurotensin receptor type 1-like [Saccostrea echinata]XP_061182300.1 neurotensin receptor type 1-like [Saccostrea echinata]
MNWSGAFNLQLYEYIQNYSQNTTIHGWIGDIGTDTFLRNSRIFYSYFTPVILVVGFVGNLLSLYVFLSRNMRGLSASTYLAALSTSDLLTLIFYVTVEWLRRGLMYLKPDVMLTFIDVDGLCQFQHYMSYMSRFLSAWLVVAFTGERYIGVCHPLRRRDICTKSGTRRIVGSIFVISAVVVLYKPILSAIYVSSDGKHYCTTDRDYDFVSFILDSIYAVLITLVPFIIITVLNILIMRRLIIRNKRKRECKIVTEESIIRLEFTIILLAISFCFIGLNIPFFAVWFRNFLHSKYISRVDVLEHFSSDIEFWQGVLYITRTIFYVNYCINFFLYSITGAYFRREVKMLFTYHSLKRDSYSRCSLRNSRSNSQTPQSYL